MQAAKKRVMFVDDEPSILAALRNLLRKERDRWDMVFASGGDVALAEVRKQPFDVVITDMRMPGMDGATLLARVKQECPATVRVMLTGHSESDAVLHALPSVHQLLAKPCYANTMRSVLDRCARLGTEVNDAAMLATIGGVDQLPSPPAIYLELKDAINHGRTEVSRIAAVISRDPAIAAKVLQLASSSYFCDAPTCSIEQAVARLGVDQIKYLVLASATFSDVRGDIGLSIDEIQGNARTSAALVRTLVAPEVADSAFAAALLRDVGHVVLGLGLGAGYRRVFTFSRSTDQPIALCEREMLGITHADVGACLLGIWGLPDAIVEPVRYHHDPGAAPEAHREVAAAIHVAEAITHDTPLDTDSLARAGLVEQAKRWRASAR